MPSTSTPLGACAGTGHTCFWHACMHRDSEPQGAPGASRAPHQANRTIRHVMAMACMHSNRPTRGGAGADVARLSMQDWLGWALAHESCTMSLPQWDPPPPGAACRIMAVQHNQDQIVEMLLQVSNGLYPGPPPPHTARHTPAPHSCAGCRRTCMHHALATCTRRTCERAMLPECRHGTAQRLQSVHAQGSNSADPDRERPPMPPPGVPRRPASPSRTTTHSMYCPPYADGMIVSWRAGPGRRRRACCHALGRYRAPLGCLHRQRAHLPPAAGGGRQRGRRGRAGQQAAARGGHTRPRPGAYKFTKGGVAHPVVFAGVAAATAPRSAFGTTHTTLCVALDTDPPPTPSLHSLPPPPTRPLDTHMPRSSASC